MFVRCNKNRPQYSIPDAMRPAFSKVTLPPWVQVGDFYEIVTFVSHLGQTIGSSLLIAWDRDYAFEEHHSLAAHPSMLCDSMRPLLLYYFETLKPFFACHVLYFIIHRITLQ